MSEHHEQVAVIAWARLHVTKYPELRLLHAIPNGGLRDRNVARKLQAEGVLPGIPDLCLPISNKHYHGLYIEMKFGNNRLTKTQRYVIDLLREAEYAVAICYSAKGAIEVVLNYLAGKTANGKYY